VKWETPHFVAYANEREYLQRQTPQALDWADQLVILTLKGASSLTWNKKEAWEWLCAHQEAFRGLLDALIAGRPTQEQMHVFTEHLRHVQPTRRWDGSTDRYRQQAAQGVSGREPWQHIRHALLAQGRGDIGDTPPQRHPPSRYVQSINAQDPLDVLYWELDQFLAKGGQSRLRTCPHCGRYLVQPTATRKIYCEKPCQQKANRTKRERNAAYQRSYRDRQRQRQITADLQRVREFVQTWKTTSGVSLLREDVLEH
jgi:uncharacterized Zn finger protein (UPF0148 family)